MASDLTLLQSLFAELTDFSSTDQLKPHARESSWGYFNELTDHVRECIKRGCSALDESVAGQVKPLTSHKGALQTQIPEGEGEAYSLLLTLLEAHAENAQSGRSDHFYTLRERAARIAHINSAQATGAGSMVTLYESFDHFLAANEKLTAKVQSGHKRSVAILKAISEDMLLTKVRQSHVRSWLTTYSEMPVQNKSPYKGKTLEALIEMDVPEDDFVSPKSVLELKKIIGSVFKLAMRNEYIDLSPARELNMKFGDRKVRYAKFTDEEVLLLKQGAEEDPKVKKLPWRKWMPLLAAYTGARRGEMVYLNTKDVILDVDTDRYYINITDKEGGAKSSAAIRRVPVHRELIREGFVEYVNSLPDGRLFLGLEPFQVSTWFTHLKVKVGIPLTDDIGNRKVFHSYRHAVVTKIMAAKVPDRLMQPVIGHAAKSDVTSIYDHLNEEKISTFFPVIDALEYIKT